MSLEYKIEVPELKKVTLGLLIKSQKIGRALSEALEAAGFLAEAGAKQALTEGPNRAIDTGFLRASTRFYEFSPSLLEGKVYPIAPYAIFVHEGTKHMRPRPFMKEGLRLAQPGIQREFRERIRDAIK